MCSALLVLHVLSCHTFGRRRLEVLCSWGRLRHGEGYRQWGRTAAPKRLFEVGSTFATLKYSTY